MVDLTVVLQSGDVRQEVKERHDLVSALQRLASVEVLRSFRFGFVSVGDKIIYDSRGYEAPDGI